MSFGRSSPPEEPKVGFFARLKAGLSRSTSALSTSLVAVFTKKKLDAETVASLEDALVRADVGAGLAHTIAANVAKGRYDSEIAEGDLRQILAAEIERVLAPSVRPFVVDRAHRPFVVLIAGVNGTGKTTTIGKLAARLGEAHFKVVLAAGDTFRAAATEQLKIWGERAGARVVSGAPGADAAPVLSSHSDQRSVGA